MRRSPNTFILDSAKTALAIVLCLLTFSLESVTASPLRLGPAPVWDENNQTVQRLSAEENLEPTFNIKIPEEAAKAKSHKEFLKVVFSKNIQRLFRESPLAQLAALRTVRETEQSLSKGLSYASEAPDSTGVSHQVKASLELAKGALRVEYGGWVKAFIEYAPTRQETQIEMVKKIGSDSELTWSVSFEPEGSQSIVKYQTYF